MSHPRLGSPHTPHGLPGSSLLTCWALRRKLLKVSLTPSVGSCRTGVEDKQGVGHYVERGREPCQFPSVLQSLSDSTQTKCALGAGCPWTAMDPLETEAPAGLHFC